MNDSFAENGGKIFTFISDGRYFAFDIMLVKDILEIPIITKIPKTPDYLTGVINHRGKAVPVMDFRRRLGFEECEYTRKSCVIVIEINSAQIGIVVDEVFDVMDILPEQITPSPAGGGTVKYFITAGEKRISLLNSVRLVRGKI